MKPFTRFLLAIVTFLALWGAATWVRAPLRTESLSEDRFYATKASWRQEFDMVIAGDSRVARALSPYRMQETLPGYRIANLGFNANSLVYTPYLRYVDGTLRSQSKKRVVLIGVDPYELTPRSAQINGFTEFADVPLRPDSPSAEADWLQIARELVAPIPVRKIAVPGETVEKFDDRGFIATQRYPLDESARLPRYRVKFDHNQVDPELAQVLLDAVATWNRRGVQVFGFRPPVSPGLEQLEGELAGFDEQMFIEEFTRLGGIWLSDLGSGYQTYDGEHLEAASAARFSDALAERLVRELSQDR